MRKALASQSLMFHAIFTFNVRKVLAICRALRYTYLCEFTGSYCIEKDSGVKKLWQTLNPQRKELKLSTRRQR